MLLLLYTGVVAEREAGMPLCSRGGHRFAFWFLVSWNVSRTREMQRATGSFWECLPVTCRAAVLVPQRKEHGIPLGSEIKLGLIHGPRTGFCAAPGKT